MLYPLKFIPVYKEKVWGGKNLSGSLNKKIPEDTLIGESWELCLHRQGTSIIANGALAGKSIEEVLNKYGAEILGENHSESSGKFPLLIKYIDANDKLSVQVHPEDEYAMANEGEQGKTEMWYIVHAKPGAKLVYGLKEGISKECFKKAIEKDQIEETLNEIEVRKGDVFFIPAGTIHAIGEGIIIAEIQQNSDTTYRVYDWGRVGLDGKPRELHIKKALDAISFSNVKSKLTVEGLVMDRHGYISTYFVCCPYFTMELLEIESKYADYLDGKGFQILMAIEGELQIIYNGEKRENLTIGETILLPASLGVYKIIGRGKVIKTYQQDQSKLYNQLLKEGFTDSEIKKIAGMQTV